MASGNPPFGNMFGNIPEGKGSGGQQVFPGLTSTPESEWPKLAVQQFDRPIERLKPSSDLHRRVLDYLMKRLWDSERSMSKFHPRWRSNEMRNQAYIDLRDYDKILKNSNDNGKPPKAVDIVIPYSFATINTMSTYLLQTFTGRHPFFQVGTYGMDVESALKMEIVLQYQLDHMRIVRWWWRAFNDAGLYGVFILTSGWTVERQMRTRKNEVPVLDLGANTFSQEMMREQREVVTYEGNKVSSLDPFMFYPDPRVPMSECGERGEYVFWREFEGKHLLKRREQDGELKWVDNAPESSAETTSGSQLSSRALLHGGDPHAGGPWHYQAISGLGNYQVDNVSIDLIPKELGLGDSTRVEKWRFIILNKAQIVLAEKNLDDHGEHPISVAEPLGSGYDFGAAGMADYIGPIQDSMSWFLNSHMENVRTSINNQWLVDPHAVEMKDVNRPGPGKTIRLKNTAINRDVRAAIQQLPVQDVTRGHIADLGEFFEIGQRVSSVSENFLGQQDSGGRKTATEVRTASSLGGSRLAALARIVSVQAMSDLTRKMSLNTQQWMSEDFYVRIVGQDGKLHPLAIGPDSLVGDFHYPIHDGTLPLDKIALLDVWRQIFIGVLQDQELRQAYSIPKMFEFIAELGGAKNIRSYRIQPGSPEQIQQQAQQGNLVPVPGGVGPAGLQDAAGGQNPSLSQG